MKNRLKSAIEQKIFGSVLFSSSFKNIFFLHLKSSESSREDDSNSIYKSFWTLIRHAAKDV